MCLGIFLNPYVFLNLDNFVGSHSFDFVVDPSQEIVCFILTSNVICVDPSLFDFVVDPNHESMKLCVLFQYVMVIVLPHRILFMLHWILILFLIVMLCFLDLKLMRV